MAADELAPAPPLPPQRRKALVVTTSTYRSPEYPDLPAATHDAANITELLADPDACGFEVTRLADVPATEIRRAINEIFHDRDRGDLILVYLSCHGVRDRKGRLYLVATDTDPTLLPATAVAARYLMDLSEDSRAGQQASNLVGMGKKRLTTLRRSTLKTIINDRDRDTVQLGSVIERIEAGRSFGGAAAPASGEQWGVIKVSAMTWGTFREQENKAVPTDSVNPCYEIRPGDLLVSRANTSDYVGAPVLVGAVRLRRSHPRRMARRGRGTTSQPRRRTGQARPD
jgi:hypothetical protein